MSSRPPSTETAVPASPRQEATPDIPENRDSSPTDPVMNTIPNDSQGNPLVGEALTQWLLTQFLQFRSNQPPADATPANTAVASGKLVAKDIGYFFPRYVKPGESAPTSDFIVESGDTVFYTSVAAFCDRIQDLIVPHGPALVKQQLVQCLKGEAATWYSQELDITDKMAIRDDPSTSLMQFTTKIEQRFRVNRSDALDKFYGSVYNVRDAQAGRHLRDFVSTKIMQAKEAEIPENQLIRLIHNMIDPTFQLSMMTISDNTTFAEYRRHCEDKGDLFLKSYRKSFIQTDPTFTPRKGYGIGMQAPASGQRNLPMVRGFVQPSNGFRFNQGKNVKGNVTPPGQTMGPDGKMYANPQNLSRPCRHCAANNRVAFHKDPDCPGLSGQGNNRNFSSQGNRMAAAHWSESSVDQDDFLDEHSSPYAPWPDETTSHYAYGSETNVNYNMTAPQYSYDDEQSFNHVPTVEEPICSPEPATALSALKRIKGTRSNQLADVDADCISKKLNLGDDAKSGNDGIDSPSLRSSKYVNSYASTIDCRVCH